MYKTLLAILSIVTVVYSPIPFVYGDEDSFVASDYQINIRPFSTESIWTDDIFDGCENYYEENCGWWEENRIYSDKVSFSDQGSVAIDTSLNFEIGINGPPPSGFGFCDYGGLLYFVDNGERQLIEHDQYDSFTYRAPAWPSEGSYELDLYISCLSSSQRNEGNFDLLKWIMPKQAWAAGENIIGTIRFTVIEKDAEVECCSSVLFLPGIMGTELYENSNKRWEPGNEGDVERLYLNDNGESINSIEAGEVIGTFDGPLFFNIDIYDSFLAELAERKTEGLISDYLAYGYDWRLSLSDILSDGELSNLVQELAAQSKSGKVAIVAHSNGGLLAKALLNQLGEEAPELVDKLILVGVPQLGTPQTLGSLLHGFDEGIPLRYSAARARDFAHNAPFTYNLLPAEDYYDSVGVSISTPLVEFKSGEATQSFINKYGNFIDSGTELHSFLNGSDGRSIPAYGDLINPGRANSAILSSSRYEMADIGSSWHAPENIEVHQIGGVGELTVAGIVYKTVNYCSEAGFAINAWYCAIKGVGLSYSPVRVIDGDGVVVEPSALSVVESLNIKKWWVNLNAADTNRYGHRDLLEIEQVGHLVLDNLIGDSVYYDYEFVSDEKPDLGNTNRLSFTLHSPLSLSYTESDGTVVDEDNPAGNYSQYTRYGEVQIIDIFEDESGVISLEGESSGSFTLEIEQSLGNETFSTTSFAGIPSATTTAVSLLVEGNHLNDLGLLQIDFEGDGTIDYALEYKEGEEVYLSLTSTNPAVSQAKTLASGKISERNLREELIQRIYVLLKLLELYQRLQSLTIDL